MKLTLFLINFESLKYWHRTNLHYCHTDPVPPTTCACHRIFFLVKWWTGEPFDTNRTIRPMWDSWPCSFVSSQSNGRRGGRIGRVAAGNRPIVWVIQTVARRWTNEAVRSGCNRRHPTRRAPCRRSKSETVSQWRNRGRWNSQKPNKICNQSGASPDRRSCFVDYTSNYHTDRKCRRG